MCGIIGYTGFSDAKGKLIKGLKALEYRGYDSAGIALERNNGTEIIKCVGKVDNLKRLAENKEPSYTGLGHTRWATHGCVNDINSHPHKFGRVTLVHNGIIENYAELSKKYSLSDFLISGTDSEIIAGVLDRNYSGNPYDAIKNTVKKLKGTFALAIMFDDIEETIFAVRNVSPIVCCKGDDGSYLASDIIAIGEYCDKYFVLPEMTVARLTKNSISVTDFSENNIEPEMIRLDFSIKGADKCGFPFYMEKEINQQPDVINDTIKSRIINGKPDFSVDNINDSIFKGIANIAVIACGTAMHAGLIGKILIEEKTSIPCSVYLASEFMYTNPVINDKTLLICISQSGETIDTLEALKYGKSKGAKSLSIVNVRGSSIARESDCVIYTQAGPEIAVASTKAYTTQLAVLYLITAKLGIIYKTLSQDEIIDFMHSIENIPDTVKDVLEQREYIHRLSNSLLTSEHVFMIGRGLDYPTLLEGSLKLKEISYIHSEAFASGELKHGTIALITESTPVIALVTQSRLKSKEISNIKEVQSRGANVITFMKKSLNDGKIHCSFELPDTDDNFTVFPAVTALQLLAYYVSSDKGLDVDKPRNLAKVVTVE